MFEWLLVEPLDAENLEIHVKDFKMDNLLVKVCSEV